MQPWLAMMLDTPDFELDLELGSASLPLPERSPLVSDADLHEVSAQATVSPALFDFYAEHEGDLSRSAHDDLTATSSSSVLASSPLSSRSSSHETPRVPSSPDTMLSHSTSFGACHTGAAAAADSSCPDSDCPALIAPAPCRPGPSAATAEQLLRASAEQADNSDKTFPAAFSSSTGSTLWTPAAARQPALVGGACECDSVEHHVDLLPAQQQLVDPELDAAALCGSDPYAWSDSDEAAPETMVGSPLLLEDLFEDDCFSCMCACDTVGQMTLPVTTNAAAAAAQTTLVESHAPLTTQQRFTAPGCFISCAPGGCSSKRNHTQQSERCQQHRSHRTHQHSSSRSRPSASYSCSASESSSVRSSHHRAHHGDSNQASSDRQRRHLHPHSHSHRHHRHHPQPRPLEENDERKPKRARSHSSSRSSSSRDSSSRQPCGQHHSPTLQQLAAVSQGKLPPEVQISETDTRLVDIYPYLCLPQKSAARALGVNTSILSKRWRAASNGCKWPYRLLCQVDHRLTLILAQHVQTPNVAFPETVAAEVRELMQRRQGLLTHTLVPLPPFSIQEEVKH